MKTEIFETFWKFWNIDFFLNFDILWTFWIFLKFLKFSIFWNFLNILNLFFFIIDFRILQFYENFEILWNFWKSYFPFEALNGLFTGKQSGCYPVSN